MFLSMITLLLGCPDHTPAGGNAETDTTTTADTAPIVDTGETTGGTTTTVPDVPLEVVISAPTGDAWFASPEVTLAGMVIPRGTGSITRLDVSVCRIQDGVLTDRCLDTEADLTSGTFGGDLDLAELDPDAPTGLWSLRVMATGALDTGAHLEGFADVAFVVDAPLSVAFEDAGAGADWATGEARTLSFTVADADEEGGDADVVIEELRSDGQVLPVTTLRTTVGEPVALELTFSAFRTDGLSWPTDPELPTADQFSMARTLRVTATNALGLVSTTTLEVDGYAGDTPSAAVVEAATTLFTGADVPSAVLTFADSDSTALGVRARVYGGWDGCGDGEVLAEESWAATPGDARWTMTDADAAALAEVSNTSGGLCVSFYVQDEVGHVGVSDDWGIAIVPDGCADMDGDHYAERSDCASFSTLPIYGGADCDDGDATSNPAGDETCDGADNDCDGDIDENGATSDEPANDDVSGAAVLIEDGTGYTTYDGGSVMTSSGTLHVVGDVDWFQMAAEDTFAHNVAFGVQLRDLPRGATAQVDVYDAAGTLRASGNGAGTFTLDWVIGDKREETETAWTFVVTALTMPPVGCDSTYSLWVGDL